ncbi:MAG: TrpR-like protein YerC/YecD [Oscillospiraceae bacterium]|nr:TrpR-like protein YerC/YecD [Oscillospiraceae bacterium]
MSNWKSESTDKLCEALLKLKTKEECYEFLEDICTIKEILDISQRLSVAMLLAKKESYTEISAETGASSATICRVNKCLEYGRGGYKKIIKRMEEKKDD